MERNINSSKKCDIIKEPPRVHKYITLLRINLKHAKNRNQKENFKTKI